MNARVQRVPILSPEQAQMDAHVDLMLRLENHERSVAQSAATVAGRRAEIPARAPLSLFNVGDVFAQQFGVRS